MSSKYNQLIHIGMGRCGSSLKKKLNYNLKKFLKKNEANFK